MKSKVDSVNSNDKNNTATVTDKIVTYKKKQMLYAIHSNSSINYFTII